MEGKHTLRRLFGGVIGLAAFCLALARLLNAEADTPERLYCATLALTLAAFLAMVFRRQAAVSSRRS